MNTKEILWILISVAIIEFDLGNLAETNMWNLLEWALIDVPLLMLLYWLLKRKTPSIEDTIHNAEV